MCGHYRRTTSEEELARLYHIPIPERKDLPISYNIAPSQTDSTNGKRQNRSRRSLFAMKDGRPFTFAGLPRKLERFRIWGVDAHLHDYYGRN